MPVEEMEFNEASVWKRAKFATLPTMGAPAPVSALAFFGHSFLASLHADASKSCEDGMPSRFLLLRRVVF